MNHLALSYLNHIVFHIVLHIIFHWSGSGLGDKISKSYAPVCTYDGRLLRQETSSEVSFLQESYACYFAEYWLHMPLYNLIVVSTTSPSPTDNHTVEYMMSKDLLEPSNRQRLILSEQSVYRHGTSLLCMPSIPGNSCPVFRANDRSHKFPFRATNII